MRPTAFPNTRSGRRIPQGRTSRLLAILAAALLASGCGLNGTDREEQQAAADADAAPSAPVDPDLAEFAEAELADSEERPRMQLQVVLDRQGFSPGAIDGSMGRSTRNALKGFQEANGLEVTGELDEATRRSLARWDDIRRRGWCGFPKAGAAIEFGAVPEEPSEQAKLDHLGYASLGEKLAERFHTTPEVLQELNPGGRPAGSRGPEARQHDRGPPNATADGLRRAGVHAGATGPRAELRCQPSPCRRTGDDSDWQRTLASLGVDGEQPTAARVVVDKSESWLKAYDEAGKLLAMFTVTSGSSQDPLPLGEWGINGVAHNPPFAYDPDLFWDVPDDEAKQHAPSGAERAGGGGVDRPHQGALRHPRHAGAADDRRHAEPRLRATDQLGRGRLAGNGRCVHRRCCSRLRRQAMALNLAERLRTIVVTAALTSVVVGRGGQQFHQASLTRTPPRGPGERSGCSRSGTLHDGCLRGAGGRGRRADRSGCGCRGGRTSPTRSRRARRRGPAARSARHHGRRRHAGPRRGAGHGRGAVPFRCRGQHDLRSLARIGGRSTTMPTCRTMRRASPRGSSVRRGQRLGSVGSSGNADPSAPHLHFAILRTAPDAEWWEPASAGEPLSLLRGAGRGDAKSRK